MKRNIIMISGIRINPLYKSQQYRDNGQTLEHFTDCTDFLLKSDLCSISVTFEADHRVCEGRSGVESFVAEIYDDETHVCVSSTVFKLPYSDWSPTLRPRIEIPVDSSMFDLTHTYTVCVHHVGRKRSGITCSLRFFDPYGPVQALDFTPVCAYVEILGTKYRHFRNPHTDLYNNRLVFVVENKDIVGKALPMMTIKVYESDGNTLSHHCVKEPCTDGRIKVSTGAFFSEMKDGAVYAELSVFGETITGFTFSNDTVTEEGVHTNADDTLRVIEDYDSDKGVSVLRRQGLFQRIEVAEAREKLSGMVGLDSVKAALTRTEQLVRFNLLRRDAGLPYSMPSLHSMYLGAPGTGKSTVARMMGKLLHGAGALSKGHVVVRERADLIGQYYSSTNENTLAAIEEARGGILFIDEAYQLHVPADPKDPGRDVINTLLTAMADETNRDWMVIFAGYTGPMLKMLEMNPGLSSRIPESNRYVFEDYTPEQLCLIARRYLEENRYYPDAGADYALEERLRYDYAHRDHTFGNARHVLNLLQSQVFPAMASRLAACERPTVDELSTIRMSDIPLLSA